jgi:hypothetical protein
MPAWKGHSFGIARRLAVVDCENAQGEKGEAVRKLLLSGVTLLASALPALAQVGGSGGLSGGGLGSSGLGSSGGLGGSGILGGTGSFTGGSTIGGSSGSGGTFLGATSGSTTSRSGTGGTQAVGSTTFLGPYFGNPQSLGIANSSGTLPTTPTFGTVLYTVTGTGGTSGSSYGGLAGSTGSVGGTGSNNMNSLGASSIGVRRAPAYTTALGFDYRPEPPSRIQSDLQQYISHSDRLASRNDIHVSVDGTTVILRGTVADEHERRLAEALSRLSPGVHDLRNELSVRGATAAASP